MPSKTINQMKGQNQDISQNISCHYASQEAAGRGTPPKGGCSQERQKHNILGLGAYNQ